MEDVGRVKRCAYINLLFVFICLIPFSLIKAQWDILIEGKVLFSRNDKTTDTEEIFKVDFQGGKAVRLTGDSTALSNSQPRWSPDGERIAFVRSIGFDQSQIMVMDADGGNIRSITKTWTQAENPVWSPDGTKLAYWQGGIYIADTSSLEGSRETLIYKYGNNPQWSADGSKIYFHAGMLADSMGISQGNFFSIDIATGEIERLTTNAIDAERYGQISPDGTRIIFAAGTYPSNMRIFMTDLSASFVDTLTQGPNDANPRWSNDGSMIVFQRDKEGHGRKFAIYSMNKDGTDLKRITEPPSGSIFGDWNPDLFIDTSSVTVEFPHDLYVTTTFRLDKNYPNPFNSSTVIDFWLPHNGWARLSIYDLLGREIIELFDGSQLQGSQRIIWDGKDKNGIEAFSGIYFFRLETDLETSTHKMLLIR